VLCHCHPIRANSHGFAASVARFVGGVFVELPEALAEGVLGLVEVEG
jgi:hypothetical protein